jgi:hypothetical protein
MTRLCWIWTDERCDYQERSQTQPHTLRRSSEIPFVPGTLQSDDAVGFLIKIYIMSTSLERLQK